MRKNILTKFFFLSAMALTVFSTASVHAGKKNVRKVQEVNFSEMSLKGAIRNPDGSYLVQKKGIKFMPLYEVQKNFDEKIRKGASLID